MHENNILIFDNDKTYLYNQTYLWKFSLIINYSKSVGTVAFSKVIKKGVLNLLNNNYIKNKESVADKILMSMHAN